MKAKALPSQETLQYLFYYNPKTGKLYNRFKTNRHPIGRTAQVKSGYVRITIDGLKYLQHRVVWMYVYGIDPGDKEVDHIDRDKQNQRIENLRLVTRKQNNENKHYKGFSFDKRKGKWAATIKNYGKSIHLGCFDNEADASAAYQKAKKELHPFYNDGIQQTQGLQET